MDSRQVEDDPEPVGRFYFHLDEHGNKIVYRYESLDEIRFEKDQRRQGGLHKWTNPDLIVEMYWSKT